MKQILTITLAIIACTQSPLIIGAKIKYKTQEEKKHALFLDLLQQPQQRIIHKLPVTLCRFVNNSTFIDFKTYHPNIKTAGAELYDPHKKKTITTATTPNAEYYPDFIFSKQPTIFALINYLKNNITTTCYDLSRSNIIRAIFRSGDGARFAANKLCIPSQDLTSCKIYHLKNGDEDLLQFKAQILRTTTSPDGQNILFVTRNGLAHLYNGKTGDIFTTPHTTDAHFSADSKYLLYDHDKTICLYDIKDQEEIPISTTQETLSTLEFSPNGDFIIFTCDVKTFYYYDIENHELKEIQFPGTAIPDEASEDGTILTYHLQIRGHLVPIIPLYDLKKQKLSLLQTKEVSLRTILNRDNSLVICSLMDGETIALYTYPSLEFYDTITLSGEDHMSVAYVSPDNSVILATSGSTGTCKIYDVKKKQVIKETSIAHFDFAPSFKFHPTRPLIFIAIDYNTLEVFNYKTGQSFELRSEVAMTALELRNDGKLFVISFGEVSLVYNFSQKKFRII